MLLSPGAALAPESPLRSFLGDAHPLVVVAGIFFAQICCLLCWYWGLISGLE